MVSLVSAHLVGGQQPSVVQRVVRVVHVGRVIQVFIVEALVRVVQVVRQVVKWS